MTILISILTIMNIITKNTITITKLMEILDMKLNTMLTNIIDTSKFKTPSNDSEIVTK